MDNNLSNMTWIKEIFNEFAKFSSNSANKICRNIER